MAKKITLYGLVPVILIMFGAWMAMSFIQKPQSEPSYSPIRIYSESGLTYQGAFLAWANTVPLTSDSLVVDISSAPFKNVLCVQASGLKPNSTASTFPMITWEMISLTSIKIRVYHGNTNTVDILGNTVGLGAPIQNYTSPTNVSISIIVLGY